MKSKNQSVSAISTVLILLLSLSANTGYLSPSVAEGQPETPLPVLLIHGYRSSNDIWHDWVVALESLGIHVKAVSFDDDPTTAVNEDECGTRG